MRLKGKNFQRKYEENIAGENVKIRNEIRQNMKEEFEEFKRNYIADKERGNTRKRQEKCCR